MTRSLRGRDVRCPPEFVAALGTDAVGHAGLRVGFDVGLEGLPTAVIVLDFAAAGADWQETAQLVDLPGGADKFATQAAFVLEFAAVPRDKERDDDEGGKADGGVPELEE